MYVLLYTGTAFNWGCFLFLNPGYFAMFAGDAQSTYEIARSKAAWGLKDFAVPHKKSHLSPTFYGTTAAPQAFGWGCISCSWPDFST